MFLGFGPHGQTSAAIKGAYNRSFIQKVNRGLSEGSKIVSAHHGSLT